MRKHGRGKINRNENDGRQVIMKYMGRKEFRPIFLFPKMIPLHFVPLHYFWESGHGCLDRIDKS